MKEKLEQLIAQVEALEGQAVTEDDLRHLGSARVNLVLVLQDHQGDPPETPRGQAASIDETLNRGDGSYRP